MSPRNLGWPVERVDCGPWLGTQRLGEWGPRNAHWPSGKTSTKRLTDSIVWKTFMPIVYLYTRSRRNYFVFSLSLEDTRSSIPGPSPPPLLSIATTSPEVVSSGCSVPRRGTEGEERTGTKILFRVLISLAAAYYRKLQSLSGVINCGEIYRRFFQSEKSESQFFKFHILTILLLFSRNIRKTLQSNSFQILIAC